MSVSHSISVGLGPKRAIACAIKRPHRRGDRRAVSVDQTGAARVESGQVDLGDRVAGHRREKSVRVEAVVDRVDIDVVDVEQQFAAGAARDGCDEIPFAHRVVIETHIGRHVFDQQRPRERVLNGVDALADQCERLLGERKRQAGR